MPREYRPVTLCWHNYTDMAQAQVNLPAVSCDATLFNILHTHTALGGGFGGASYGGGSDRPSYGSGGGFGAGRTDSFGMSSLCIL